jgi:hypothetical protein
LSSSISAAAAFSSRCSIEDVPGIGTTTGEYWSSQGERDLLRRSVVLVRDTPERLGTCRSPPARADREVREEDEPEPLARVHDRVRTAIGDAEPVLHGHDRSDLPRTGQLRLVDVREADVTDLPFRLQLRERADRFLDRDVVVDAVQLVELDAPEP